MTDVVGLRSFSRPDVGGATTVIPVTSQPHLRLRLHRLLHPCIPCSQSSFATDWELFVAFDLPRTQTAYRLLITSHTTSGVDSLLDFKLFQSPLILFHSDAIKSTLIPPFKALPFEDGSGSCQRDHAQRRCVRRHRHRDDQWTDRCPQTEEVQGF